LFFACIFLSAAQVQALTYYVDSNVGSDSNSCSAATNPSTPKRTVYGFNKNCSTSPGDVIKLRGTFTERIEPNASGAVLYDAQLISGVGGNQITFNTSISGLNPQTDYVAIYHSRRGNSGAFEVISFSGNSVVVDTSDLPWGQFINESASDPGDLTAAILRPIHYTAWEKANPPVWNSDMQTYISGNNRVIMLSYLKSLSGYPNTTAVIWPAFEINGFSGGNADYQIFDHLEVQNADAGIAVEFVDFQTNYDIIQHNWLHNVGNGNGYSNEVIYFGNAYHPERVHNYPQIMYNKIGPHKQGSKSDGIEIKPSANNATVYGNEIVSIMSSGCDDAPIKSTGPNSFISNNYIHDINPPDRDGCGISIIDDYPDDPNGGSSGTVVANNIIANVAQVGIRVMDADDVKVLNNTLYNIFQEPDCEGVACTTKNAAILVYNYQGSTENVEIKNNIVADSYQGIGRYVYSNSFAHSIAVDYNIVHNVAGDDYIGSISLGSHNLQSNPALINPSGGNYALSSGSIAVNAGVDMSSYFNLDNHDAADPQVTAFDINSIVDPIFRQSPWDIGAYEFGDGGVVTISGDANGDGKVDGIDYVIWLSHYNQYVSGAENGDFNGDNKVDGMDYVIWLQNYSG